MTTTPADRVDFGAGRLFVSDARLAFGALNYARYETLRRVFGVSREEANLLTFVLAVGGTDAGLRGARRAVRVTRKLSRADSAIGGFVLRGAVLGITGQGSRDVAPLFGTLLAAAMLAGLFLPGLRRAAVSLRATEHRVRLERERHYSAARRALGAPSPSQSFAARHASATVS
jgi:hypothetical protein